MEMFSGILGSDNVIKFQKHCNFSNLVVLLLYLYKYSDDCIICAYHAVAVVFA